MNKEIESDSLSVQRTFRTLFRCVFGLLLAIIAGVTACNFPYGSAAGVPAPGVSRVASDVEKDLCEEIARVDQAREDRATERAKLYAILGRVQRLRKELDRMGTPARGATVGAEVERP